MTAEPAPLPGESRPATVAGLVDRLRRYRFSDVLHEEAADALDAQAQRVAVLESLAIEAAEQSYCGWCEDYAPDDCRFLEHDAECPHGRLIAAVLALAEAREAVPPATPPPPEKPCPSCGGEGKTRFYDADPEPCLRCAGTGHTFAAVPREAVPPTEDGGA